MKSLFFRSVLTLLLVMIVWLVWVVWVPVNLPTTPYNLTVGPDRTMAQVAHSLEREGVIRNRLVMSWLARLTGHDRHLRAGLYHFSGSASMWDILRRFAEGKPDEDSMTVIEGWTFQQFRRAINQNPDVVHTTLGWSDAQILQAIKATSPSAEGWFFPSTYFFTPGSSDLDIFSRAYQTMQNELNAAWQTRSANLPLQTPYQLLILSSLIEKETARSQDRRLVAAVFVNRLKKGMRLQTDPSVIYGLGDQYQGKISKADLKHDTDYNTYTRNGLTPTPIALPGRAALQAAAHPEDSPVLYFVASGEGNSYFSQTLQQHNQAVRKFILKKGE